MAFRIALAQFSPQKAQVSANLDRICEFALQSQREGADLCCFAETITSAYFLEGGVLECALAPEELGKQLHARLAGKLSGPLDLCLGFYEVSDGNLYNSCGYFELTASGAKVVHVYRKFFLPTYGVFDEQRFVSRGRDLGVFETRFGTIGILICEDVWHSILPTLTAVAGAKLIIVPSASPARGFSGEEPGNLARYRRMVTAVSDEHGVFCANVHLGGFEGGKGFVGGSMVTDPFGNVMAQSPILDDHLLIADVDLEVCEIARANLPLVSDLQGSWDDINRIVNGLAQKKSPQGKS